MPPLLLPSFTDTQCARLSVPEEFQAVHSFNGAPEMEPGFTEQNFGPLINDSIFQAWRVIQCWPKARAMNSCPHLNLFNKDFPRPTLVSAQRIKACLFSRAPSQEGGRTLINSLWKKGVIYPSQALEGSSENWGVPAGSAGSAGTCFLGAIFPFVL